MNNERLITMEVKKDCLKFNGTVYMDEMSIMIKKIKGLLILTEVSQRTAAPHVIGQFVNGSISEKECVEFVKEVYSEGSVVYMLYRPKGGENGEPLNTYYVVGTVPV